MGAIYKKELRSYFTGMTGAIFIGFILLIAGIYIAEINFNQAYSSFDYSISMISFVYLPAIPVLTMRSLAEEKSTRTDQLLYSLPISLSKIIMAKYFAIVTVLAIPMVILGIVPLIMSAYGSVHFAVAYSALFATFLLGCALSAIGMFISSTTESQVISAVISIAVFFAFYIMNGIVTMIPTTAASNMILFGCVALVAAILLYVLTKNVAVSGSVGIVLLAVDIGLFIWDKTMFEGAFANMLSAFDVFGKVNYFYQSIFDLSAVVYYLSIVILFVFFTIQSMEKKRWSEVD